MNLKARAKKLKMDIPTDVREKNRKQAEGMWQDGKPKKWYYAIPVVIIWGIVVVVICKTLWGS